MRTSKKLSDLETMIIVNLHQVMTFQSRQQESGLTKKYCSGHPVELGLWGCDWQALIKQLRHNFVEERGLIEAKLFNDGQHLLNIA